MHGAVARVDVRGIDRDRAAGDALEPYGRVELSGFEVVAKESVDLCAIEGAHASVAAVPRRTAPPPPPWLDEAPDPEPPTFRLPVLSHSEPLQTRPE
jgi:hypothetical protein